MNFDLRLDDSKIAVIGLGYVGLVVALGRHFDTLCFDPTSPTATCES